MNYVAQEVERVYREMVNEFNKYDPPYPQDKEAIKRGIQISETVTKQEEFVHPTPIMKNALIVYGDSKYEKDAKGEYHATKVRAGEDTKAQQELLKILHAALRKEFGEEIHDYPEGIPFTNPEYYYVDCWNAFDEIKERFWDIVPGQEKELGELFKKYEDPKTNMDPAKVFKLFRDPAMQKTLQLENRMWPMTKASRDITSISDPFMSKKSGTSYPLYHNDSKPVKKGSSQTWGALEVDTVRKVFESEGIDGLIKFAKQNSTYTGYTRRQRGKARPLIAASRRLNLVINMINGVEQQNLIDTPYLRVPFVNEDVILEELAQTCELALKYGWTPANIDASKWDINLGAGLNILQDAERYVLAQGDLSRKLVMCRMLCNSKAYFVNGRAQSVKKIFGRQYSGYDDTTLGNTKANRTSATYGLIKTDPKYIQDIASSMKFRHVLTVGDDLLAIFRDRAHIQKYIKTVSDTFGIVIHGDEKFAIGVMFIQWRVFKDGKKYVMAYNVPRVFRSALSKEDAKHLGRGGWTFAFWQQLSKLRRFKPALKICVNILAAFDQYHLSLDTPVAELNAMVKKEDQEAREKGITETTAERMYKSNPNIAGLTERNGKVELDTNYFTKLRKEMLEVYDPHYLETLGFKNPDLSVLK